MKATYDKEADAMYIHLNKGKVHKTLQMNDFVLADVDKKGKILGIEMLFVSTQIPKREIAQTVRTGRIPAVTV